jgi:lysophospholipase L1-like esterase
LEGWLLSFLKSDISRLAAALTAAFALSAPAYSADAPAIFKEGARIVFQGDSITDGGHGQDPAHKDHFLGDGYAFLIAARIGADSPGLNLTFVNRGHSGNTVADLAARWQRDTIDLRPDVLSILIGVNDVWRSLRERRDIPFAQVESTYDKLLSDTLTALPNVKIVLGEPFIEPGFENKAEWDRWEAEIQKMRGIVERLAAKYGLPMVHYQRMFDEACRRAPPDYWIFDGVHPLYAGHQLMADEWLRTVSRAWPH